jgi:hypothetical protein
MSADIDEIRGELTSLGVRIDAKIADLHKQGVLHGAARQEAADFQIQHAKMARRANDHPTVVDAVKDEIATDAEILKHSFERWIAHIDKESER